ncbi:MAG: hypothetical protein ACI9SB_001600 [Candidatus Azotimanducaceae bacterium]|jgi:hypothetical protein
MRECYGNLLCVQKFEAKRQSSIDGCYVVRLCFAAIGEILAVLFNGVCVSAGEVENAEMKVSIEAG